MSTITLDGRRVYLYRVGLGSYSNYSEEWWAHAREMSRLQVVELLIATMPRLDARYAEWSAERDAVAGAVFGCAADDVAWEYSRDSNSHRMKTPRGDWQDFVAFSQRFDGMVGEDLHAVLMELAGFRRLEPTATHNASPSHRCKPDGILEELLKEQNEVHDALALEAIQKRVPSDWSYQARSPRYDWPATYTWGPSPDGPRRSFSYHPETGLTELPP